MVLRSFLRLTVLLASSAALLARSGTVSFLVVRAGAPVDGWWPADGVPGLVTAPAALR
jgi:hypothetical protein